jgi:hypothetical protein
MILKPSLIALNLNLDFIMYPKSDTTKIKFKRINEMGKIYNKMSGSFVRINVLLFCFLIAGLLSIATVKCVPVAKLKVTVRDDAGNLIPFHVRAYNKSKLTGQLWERGEGILPLPVGSHTILVSHGFDFDAVRIDSLYLPEGITEKQFILRKRYDIKSMGWYCGENHMHGQHGITDKPQTFRDAARLAEANGLNYIQIAQYWTPEFEWNDIDTLKFMSKDATSPLVTVNWNLESPKSYMEFDDGGKSGNLHCYGHGCTLGLKDRPYDKDFWFSGPNFRIIHEIHRQNAVVTLAHPVRFWFNNGNFVSNMASEIAFDYIVGEGYDGVDIFNDGEPYFFQHERVWWNLLNMGYKVSGTASTDGSIVNGDAGRFRTYTRIDGEFSWDKIAQGIRSGVCIASSGPMVLFKVDGKDPGSEFPADGRMHDVNLQVWSGPLPDETLVSVQVVRNGEIVQAWDLRNKKIREWSCNFNISDNHFAWYVIRVLSTCKDPRSLAAWDQPAELYDVAVANPVYFMPVGFDRPKPAKAKIKLRVGDEKGNPIKAIISVVEYAPDCTPERIKKARVTLVNTTAQVRRQMEIQA